MCFVIESTVNRKCILGNKHKPLHLFGLTSDRFRWWYRSMKMIRVAFYFDLVMHVAIFVKYIVRGSFRNEHRVWCLSSLAYVSKSTCDAAWWNHYAVDFQLYDIEKSIVIVWMWIKFVFIITFDTSPWIGSASHLNVASKYTKMKLECA